jgi:hypothetical protein
MGGYRGNSELPDMTNATKDLGCRLAGIPWLE